MGKKNRLKRERVQVKEKPLSPSMDPALIEAWTKGRSAGYKDGKVDGTAEMMILFESWITDIDQHVKGIGDKTKESIHHYIADRIGEAVNQNQINDGQVSIVKDNRKTK
jgi:hypothetical protein